MNEDIISFDSILNNLLLLMNRSSSRDDKVLEFGRRLPSLLEVGVELVAHDLAEGVRHTLLALLLRLLARHSSDEFGLRDNLSLLLRLGLRLRSMKTLENLLSRTALHLSSLGLGSVPVASSGVRLAEKLLKLRSTFTHRSRGSLLLSGSRRVGLLNWIRSLLVSLRLGTLRVSMATLRAHWLLLARSIVTVLLGIEGRSLSGDNHHGCETDN